MLLLTFLRKHLFLITVILYLLLACSLIGVRVLNPSIQSTWNGDYQRSASLFTLVSKGISPYDTKICWVGNESIPPLLGAYSIGYTLLGASLIKVTGLSGWLVTVAIIPLIFSILFPFSVWFLSKQLKFSQVQKTILFLSLIFIIDDSILALLCYPQGQSIGIALALIGLGLFFGKRYLSAGILFALALFFNLVNVVFPIILLFYLFLKIIITRKNLSWKPLVSIAIGLICFTILLCPLLILSTNGITAINYLQHKTSIYSPSQYFLSTSPLGFFTKIIPYPLLCPLWSEVSALTTRSVCLLFGYNLTDAQITNIYAFHITPKDLFPMGIALSYSIGLVVLTLLVLYEMIKQKKYSNDWVLISLSAYAITILVCIFYMFTNIAIFPNRLPIYLGISLCFAYTSLKQKYSYLFYGFCTLMALRTILWVIVMIGRGGL